MFQRKDDTNMVNPVFIEMLKGGVIMDVMDAQQAKIAQDAGACAVMALERVPALITRDGGIARASDPKMIKEIQEAVSIPVMAKCRIGHFIEAKILESLEVDCVDESEVLTPADNDNHIDKSQFRVPFVCGATDLFEALRRIDEGAVLIRCKGKAGTGNIAEAVRHLKKVKSQIASLQHMDEKQLKELALQNRVQLKTIIQTKDDQALPVPFFAAGGVATPADAVLCMHLGAQSVFVGSGIFLSSNPLKRAKAVVNSVNHWQDYDKIAEFSTDLGKTM